jgi:hypothetical protein
MAKPSIRILHATTTLPMPRVIPSTELQHIVAPAPLPQFLLLFSHFSRTSALSYEISLASSPYFANLQTPFCPSTHHLQRQVLLVQRECASSCEHESSQGPTRQYGYHHSQPGETFTAEQTPAKDFLRSQAGTTQSSEATSALSTQKPPQPTSIISGPRCPTLTGRCSKDNTHSINSHFHNLLSPTPLTTRMVLSRLSSISKLSNKHSST